MFNAQIFERAKSEECLLRDRKEVIYHVMHSDDALNVEHGQKLIKHAIAMANTARMLGKPAYLLFGVRDHDGDIIGLKVDLKDESGAELPVEKWRDKLNNHFANFLQDNVRPIFNCWEFRCGYVFDKNGVEKLVAYLMFEPTAYDTPFHVANDIKKFKLRKDACWIRFGESSQEVDVEEIAPDGNRFRFAYAEVLYILPSLWKGYYERLRSNSEFNEATELLGYQDLFNESGDELRSVVGDFLTQENHKALVISGVAGIGKTLFLRRLISQIAGDGVAECEVSLQTERFNPPSTYVPIYLKLRNSHWRGDDDLAHVIVSEATRNNQLWHPDSKKPAKLKALFKRPDIKWLICFDGFDEVWNANDRSVLLYKLRRFLAQTASVKVVVATRPVFASSLMNELEAIRVNVAALTESQIRSYLQAYGDMDAIDEVIDYLRTPTNGDLWTLCALPINLDFAAQTLVGRPARSLLDDQSDTEPQIDAVRPTASLLDVPVVEESSASDAADQVDANGLLLSGPLTAEEVNRADPKFEAMNAPLKLGVVVDQIYRQVWKREEQRRESELSQPTEFRLLWDRLSDFAFRHAASKGVFSTDKVRKVLSREKAPYWLASLGILKEAEEAMSSYRFLTECTHAYFAVQHATSDDGVEQESETILREVQRFQKSRYRQMMRIATDLGIPIASV